MPLSRSLDASASDQTTDCTLAMDNICNRIMQKLKPIIRDEVVIKGKFIIRMFVLQQSNQYDDGDNNQEQQEAERKHCATIESRLLLFADKSPLPQVLAASRYERQ